MMRARDDRDAMVWPRVIQRLSQAVGVRLWLDGNQLWGRVPAAQRKRSPDMRSKLQGLVAEVMQQVANASPGARDNSPDDTLPSGQSTF